MKTNDNDNGDINRQDGNEDEDESWRRLLAGWLGFAQSGGNVNVVNIVMLAFKG